MPRRLRNKIAAAVLCSFFVGSCTMLEDTFSDSEYMLGTIIRITIKGHENDAPELIRGSFAIVSDIENAASVTIDGSELMNVNENAYYESVALSDTLYELISGALYFCRASDGALDIGIGKLIDLWGIGTDKARVPDNDELEKFIDFHGYEHIILDDAERTVRFDDERVKISLGACAKGYAEDKVGEYLRSCGVTGYTLDFGGSAAKPEGGFVFAVRSPDGGTACSAEAVYASVVTSGDYERFFEANGRRYHHILDSSSGFPADTGIRGVTVNTDSAFVGDCLSTAAFVLGEDTGAALLSEFGCEYIIISASDSITVSDGLSLLKTKS